MPDEPRSPTFYHNFVAMHVSVMELVAGRVHKHVPAHAPRASGWWRASTPRDLRYPYSGPSGRAFPGPGLSYLGGLVVNGLNNERTELESVRLNNGHGTWVSSLKAWTAIGLT